MQQRTFPDDLFERYRKPIRHERIFDEMNRVLPRAALAAAIEPVYPKADGPGRPPVGVDLMLRIHLSATVAEPVERLMSFGHPRTQE